MREETWGNTESANEMKRVNFSTPGIEYVQRSERFHETGGLVAFESLPGPR